MNSTELVPVKPMMAMQAMPTPAAVKPLARREAGFSARPNVRFGSEADVKLHDVSGLFCGRKRTSELASGS
jgi:hypothetical protein